MLKLAELRQNLGNFDQAKSFFSKACEGGEVSSCHEVGLIEKDLENYIESEKYLKKACKDGLEKSCSEVQIVEDKTKRDQGKEDCQ